MTTLALALTDDPALADLCRRFHVRRLEIFGSAARDDFDPTRSDIDLIVAFEQGEEQFLTFMGLKDALEAHFSRRVDLLTDQPIQNSNFRPAVDRDRTLI